MPTDIRTLVLEKLWFDDLTDSTAEQEAARSLAATVAKLQGLRPFSPAVQKLVSTLRNEFYSVSEVTTIIESDPSLAARVMRTVNSAAYALRQQCTSVAHAVTLLGANAIGQMATALSIIEVFSGTGGPAAIVSQHSAAVGALARVLATNLRLADRETAFTCGLLHDLGKLLMLQVSSRLKVGKKKKNPYVRLLMKNAKEPDAIHEAEREMYGYDHAVLAGHIMEAWSIPEPVPQVIAWHHQGMRAYEDSQDIAESVALIRLADQLAYFIMNLPDPFEGYVGDLKHDPAMTVLNVTHEQLEPYWEELCLACKPSLANV